MKSEMTYGYVLNLNACSERDLAVAVEECKVIQLQGEMKELEIGNKALLL